MNRALLSYPGIGRLGPSNNRRDGGPPIGLRSGAGSRPSAPQTIRVFTMSFNHAHQAAAERDDLRLTALGLMTAGIVHDVGNMIQVLSSAVSIFEHHPSVDAAPALRPVI